MAQDWPEILGTLEGHYPRSVGAGGQDSKLRIALSRFANSLFKNVERERRWTLAYGSDETVVTVANTATYLIPSTLLTISRLYYRLATGGIVPITLYDPQELRLIYGEGVDSQAGPPQHFAIKGTSIQLFPKPDFTGPSAGNYTLVFEGYGALPPIIETSGNIAAAFPDTSLVVPSGAYLTRRGLAATGSYVSIRGAGELGALGVADSWLTNWTAIGATTVTLGTGAVTAVTDGQVFFNSQNWLIRDFDHVVIFGVLREVAAYLKENFDVWNRRYVQALEEMAGFDFDRRRTLGLKATAVTGQNQAQLRQLDFPGGVEVRGGIL